MVCSFVRQPRSLGLGHAVLCAAPLVGNEPFAVLLADDLMVGEDGGPPVLTQMVDIFAKLQTSLLAVQEVPTEHVNRYGIVAGPAKDGRVMRVEQMVEKPKPADAPSRMGVAGRYILTPQVFDFLRTQTRGSGGEIQLTDSIARLIGTQGVHAYTYLGKRYDCGSKLGFLEATVELGLKHPEVGAGFGEFLNTLLAARTR